MRKRALAKLVARLLFAEVGAVLGAALVAILEANTASRAMGGPQAPSFVALTLAAFALLVPIALLVGLPVGAFALMVDPSSPRSPAEHLSAWNRAEALVRAGRAAAALLVPLALVAWCVALANAGRVSLADGAPIASATRLAASAIGALAVILVLTLAALLPVRRALVAVGSRAPALIHPAVTGTFGLVLAALVLALGVRLGNVGGDGPAPLAVFGVLARPELDLRPVFHLAALALLAYALPIALRNRVSVRSSIVALLLVGGAVFCTAYEARALNRSPRIARAMEEDAPLGKLALTMLRRVTDRDHDGASPLFGGGDCNDRDPLIGPNAVDVPGNGIDEDCTGTDLPLPPEPEKEPEPPPGAKPLIDRDLNILFITIDTFRTDVGFMGYPKPVTPNIDRLAAKSTIYDRAYALSSYTGKSIGPLFIGKYPSETLRDGAHFNTYAEGNVFLAERLRDAGVHTMGCASFWYFQSKYGLSQGMDDWDMSALPYSDSRDTDTSVTSEELTDVAIKQLTENGDRRFFQWVHYFDPHASYMPHDDAPNFYDSDVRSGEAAYLTELWFTDKHVGRLLDFVESQAWAKDTVIVVTGDHGEAFGEHELFFHGSDLWEPIVRTPLVIYVPGAEPHHVPVKRSAIDLTPTMLDVMRVPQPEGELSGRSMLRDIFPRREGEEDAGADASADADADADADAGPDVDAGASATFEERDIYMEMPPGPILPLRRAFIHGPTPGLKLLDHGGGYYQLIDLTKDEDEMGDVSWDNDRLKMMNAAYDLMRARVREIWVPPDAPEPKPDPLDASMEPDDGAPAHVVIEAGEIPEPPQAVTVVRDAARDGR